MIEAKMVLAVAEAITQSRPVSWIYFSDGTPTPAYETRQLEHAEWVYDDASGSYVERADWHNAE